MDRTKLSLYIGTALSLAWATPVVAQNEEQASAGTAQTNTVGMIIVEARRVEENLQTTPVAVTALSSDDLERQQLVNISQLQNSVPSLTIASAVAQPGSATVFIRGQGSSDGLIAIDQAIGVYINGVYSARSSGGAFDLVDVARVEVLRGPQGTLFGRNTTGGAINIIPNEPTDEFEGLLRVDYGNYDTLLTRAVVNIPFDDVVQARFAYQHREQDGFGRNLLLDQQVGGHNSEFFRGSVRIAPAQVPATLLLTYDYTDLRTHGEAVGLRSFTPTAANGGVIAACAGLIPGAAFLANLCPYGVPTGDSYANYLVGNGIVNDFHDVFNNTPSYGEVQAYGISAVLDVELSDNVSFKSISAWRDLDTASLSDNDGTPYLLTGGLLPTDGNFITQNQFSQEVQLTGRSFDNRLDWILGGFYFVENGLDRSRSASVYPLNPLVGYVDGTIRNESIAGYAQVTFSVTDAIRLTAGTRYTRDNRQMQIRNRDRNAFTGAFTSSIPSLLDGDPNDPFRASFERSFDYWSYTFGVDWQATDDVFLYAKTSRAYRSGGFNTRAVAGGVPPVSFEPERVTDYEIGGKIDFLNGRGRFNVAGYYVDFSSVQRNLIGVAGARLVSGADNAASAHIWGLEGELTIVPIDGLTLAGSAALTYPRYDTFISTIDGTDLSDTPFIYTPEEMFTVNADYEVPIYGTGTLNFHADFSYRTEAFAVPLKNPTFTDAQNQALQETSRIPGYGLLNARISFRLDDPDLELAVYARNITDKEYVTRLLGLEGTALGVTSYMAGDPRTYGVSATWRF